MSETCCCLLFPTEYKSGRAMLLGNMGFRVRKTVLMVSFEGFSNRFLLVRFFLFRSYFVNFYIWGI